MSKEAKSSYFDLPALDVSVAFPQATPASVFPKCSKIDFYSTYLCIYTVRYLKKELDEKFVLISSFKDWVIFVTG